MGNTTLPYHFTFLKKQQVRTVLDLSGSRSSSAVCSLVFHMAACLLVLGRGSLRQVDCYAVVGIEVAWRRKAGGWAGRDKEKGEKKTKMKQKTKTIAYKTGVWGDLELEWGRCADVQRGAAELRAFVDANLDCGGNRLRFAACRTSKGRKKSEKGQGHWEARERIDRWDSHHVRSTGVRSMTQDACQPPVCGIAAAKGQEKVVKSRERH